MTTMASHRGMGEGVMTTPNKVIIRGNLGFGESVTLASRSPLVELFMGLTEEYLGKQNIHQGNSH